MIRYRIFCLIFLCVRLAHVLCNTQVTEEKIAKSPNNVTLKKSLPNSEADELIHTFTNWLYPGSAKIVNTVDDLKTSASEYQGEKYLPANFNFRGRGRNCYDCNSEPWIPIAGRSLQFPTLVSSHSNSLEYNNKPYFKEKGSSQFNLFRPPSDHYGAPQGKFNYPATGEVVDFMLPPPYKIPAVDNAYIPPVFSHQKFITPTPNIYNLSPPPSIQVAPSWSTYGAPPRRLPLSKYSPPFPTTPLRPVSQDILPPPLIGVHNLPLENNLPPAMPSDSYGRPIHEGHAEPIASSSEYTRVSPIKHFNNFDQHHFVKTHQKDFTDVQVLPSVKIADYTASIEHPINLIQSPIFDLNIEDQKINEEVGTKDTSSREKLSENPIVVDDSYTSSSDINTNYSSNAGELTRKRHNDKYLGSGEFTSQMKNADVDLSDKFIQKLLLEHDIIDVPNKQIIGIQKSTIDPQKVKTKLNLVSPSLEYDSWGAAKNSKKLQIIVPYIRSSQSTAIYNREYSTLAPVFVPPPITSEATTTWTQLMQDIRTISNQMEPAKGFVTSSSTEVYNINDFIAKKNFPSYDITSLQKNIDDWTHQAYSNRHGPIGQFTTKQKKIPEEYFGTTASYSDNIISSDTTQDFKDHELSNSDKKEIIIEDINSNLILPPESSKEARSDRLLGNKATWESNKVTLSNSTHEKVYVVTPQSYHIFPTSAPSTAFSMAPKVENGQINNGSTMTKISVRIEKPEGGDDNQTKPLKVVYSEWPHLINDLETTTTSKPTTRHPLFGLMDLAPYTVPSDSMVETIGGHSKVTSVGTSPLIKFTSTTPTPFQHSNGTVKVSPES